MKHPKRYCADCDAVVFLTIRQGKTHAMYHCRKCGGEVCRVGDGDTTHGRLAVAGLDVRSIPEEMSEDANLLGLALGNPDVLSDEHSMWSPHDRDAEYQRLARVVAFRAAYEGLTPRQKQIVAAVDRFGTQEAAASQLGITRGTIAVSLIQIQKKLSKHINKAGKQGLKGSHAYDTNY